mmetsp:Transcript_49092/g.114830  ORF Transcript_49092/g.114830 Transcript_49092/m.114830 type:complete len:99 (-) Transcript_49092:15-311(-)
MEGTPLAQAPLPSQVLGSCHRCLAADEACVRPSAEGERMNLVLWSIPANPKGILTGSWESQMSPSPECLSSLYDPDYREQQRSNNLEQKQKCYLDTGL